MEFLAPFHPQITHAPIVLIVVGFLFEIAGRLFDRDWWRKAAFAMLILGVVSAYVAVLSGEAASEPVEHRQGVPEETVDAHGDLGKLALWLGLGAVVARALAGRLGPLRGAAAGLGLLLHLGAAVVVGIAAHRGGQLIFEHGAGVRLHGRLLESGAPPAGPAGRPRGH